MKLTTLLQICFLLLGIVVGIFLLRQLERRPHIEGEVVGWKTQHYLVIRHQGVDKFVPVSREQFVKHKMGDYWKK